MPRPSTSRPSRSTVPAPSAAVHGGFRGPWGKMALVATPATARWTTARETQDEGMSSEDLEKYESEMELQLYREYRDVVGLFSHVVETERRFYLCNSVDVVVRSDGGEVFFDVTMHDAWVWDIYRPARFAKTVRVVTFKDVNVEELAKSDLELPKGEGF